MNDSAAELSLDGLDGSNPLAFLAALGTLQVATRVNPESTLHWGVRLGRYRPVLIGLGGNAEHALNVITDKLLALSTTPFEINSRLPFDSEEFREFLVEASNGEDRRNADFGCALGSEVCVDEKSGSFKDTAFRMIRSKDNQGSGNGFLNYALRIRHDTDCDKVRRTLFQRWDYNERKLDYRWDPSGDEPYAYRADNPSGKQPPSMRGANSLALEALPLFPVVPQGQRVQTTGFHRRDKVTYFTWPIWSAPATVDMIRSMLTLPELCEAEPDRNQLTARGISEIYRCRRFSSSQYYSNFSPAKSV